MNILVVGGAGYIGSHTVRRLGQLGHQVWSYDNLSAGHSHAVPDGRLIRGDLADQAALQDALRDHAIEAVMHFAAFASVPESVQEPARYYRNNIVGTLNLLDAMRSSGVGKIVFSSTAAVYGLPQQSPITEETSKNPINPYGFTKLVVENALADYSRAYGLGYAVLRYFNASGASSDASIGEDHSPESHLIPIILQVALGQRDTISVTGTDYPTPDGSCIRDFIHVEDLAEAHCLVLDGIRSGAGLTYNVGTGQGYSVREVINAARRVTGHPIPSVDQPRRPGDPPELVASSLALRRDTGWEPRFPEIESIVSSAWKWHQSHPRGYDDRLNPG